jgi:hypothetical protein
MQIGIKHNGHCGGGVQYGGSLVEGEVEIAVNLVELGGIKYGISLIPKALQWPNFGQCCFKQVPVIRRCDVIFWEFYGK